MRYLLTLAFLILTSPVWAMEHYTDVLQDTHGNIIGQATVHVYLPGTTTHATIYSDNISTVKANPFSSNTFDGTYDFYAADGRYDLVFSKPGVTFNALLTKGIALFDVSTFSSPSAFSAITSGTNITAAMVLGSGSSLTYAGTGSLNASLFRGNAVVGMADGGTGVSSATDDGVLVGSGAAWVVSIIPSCSNPTTSKLLYNNGTNAFSCGTDQSAGGSTTFDAIGAGTNTTAAFVVGTGSSLSVSGTGAITANNFWPNVVTVNAGNSPYTALTTNATILCDTTAAARIVTLPAATNKVILTFFNVGANTCTINRAGADTITTGISSSTSFIIRNSGSTFWLQPDGTSVWYVGG